MLARCDDQVAHPENAQRLAAVSLVVVLGSPQPVAKIRTRRTRETKKLHFCEDTDLEAVTLDAARNAYPVSKALRSSPPFFFSTLASMQS